MQKKPSRHMIPWISRWRIHTLFTTFVKQTISIRNAFPEIARGTNTFEKDLSNDNVCIFTREYNGEKAVLIFNPSKDEASVDVSSLGVNDAVAMLQTTKKAPSYKDGTAKLPAYSVLVLK
mgnify:FL=1